VKQSTLSASNSQEWSEPIIVLGKGVPAYSSKFGCLTYCVAGVGKSGSWYRLYPLFYEKLISRIVLVEKFDIIKAGFSELHPESNRPESKKIHPEYVEKIGKIEDAFERSRILLKYTERGSFLHDDSWNGKKTLGMINPKKTKFAVAQGLPKAKFQCDDNHCTGHICEIGELMKFDAMGRPLLENREILESRLSAIRKGEMRFVMGTLANHPQRWILISINVMTKSKN